MMRTTPQSIKEKDKNGTPMGDKNAAELSWIKKSIIPVSGVKNPIRITFIDGNFQSMADSMQYRAEVRPVVPTEPMPSIQPQVEPSEPQPPMPIPPPTQIPEPAQPSVPPIVPLPQGPPAPGSPVVPEVPSNPMAAYQRAA